MNYKLLTLKNFSLLLLFCFSLSIHSQELPDIDEKEISKEIEEIDSLILKDPSAENYYLKGYYFYQIITVPLKSKIAL